MRSKPPPGVAFLIQRIPQIFGPVIAVYLIYSALLTWNVLPYADSPLLSSTGVKLLISLLFMPMVTLAGVKLNEFLNHRRAQALGAKLPVRYEPKKWGGLDIISRSKQQVVNGYIGDVVSSLMEETGSHTVMFRTLLEDRIATTEPNHIKIMLATQFENFIKNSQANGMLERLLGNGIFAVDGDMWKFHRNTARLFFNKDRISDFDNFEKHIQIALDAAQNRINEGYAVDLQDLTSRFTMDSATTYLFDHDVQSLEAVLPYPPALERSTPARGTHPSDAFCHAFAHGQKLVVDRVIKGSNWPLFEFWTDSVRDQRDNLGSYIDPILQRALERKRSNQDEKNEGAEKAGGKHWASMLEYLVNQTDDETLIMDTILSMLIAGRDTTGCCLTFSLYMLSEHPTVLSRLREEVSQNVGPDRPPTLEDIREMKLLRAVLNETLRLYPPVANNSKKAVNATVFPSKNPEQPDLFIPAGVRVSYNVLLMHRRKDLWGPDALEWDPDRWLDDRTKKYFTSNPFIFTPFHAGPRICLGQQFAYHEASYFLIRFLQRFAQMSHRPELQRPEDRPPAEWMGKIEGPKGRDTIWLKENLTTYSKGGLWMDLEMASSKEQ